MDAQNLGFAFGVFVGGLGSFIFSLGLLNIYFKEVNARKIDAITKRYVYMLNQFGIKKGEDGVWRMHPYDRDEIWTKQEEPGSS